MAQQASVYHSHRSPRKTLRRRISVIYDTAGLLYAGDNLSVPTSTRSEQIGRSREQDCVLFLQVNDIVVCSDATHR